MTDQDLFGEEPLLNPPPIATKRNDPVTSRIAEENITKSGKRETHAQMVLKILKYIEGRDPPIIAYIKGLFFRMCFVLAGQVYDSEFMN